MHRQDIYYYATLLIESDMGPKPHIKEKIVSHLHIPTISS